MEHVTITQIGENYRLTPDKGYKIADKFGNLYSEVICKESEIGDFTANPEL